MVTKPTRRMGSIDSAQGEAMLDAAETILKEQGYGSLTSRSVAEVLGCKQRLVYYYFSTMDELIQETFKRLAIRELGRLRDAFSSDQPLREVWNICINTSDARLIAEFMALANHNEGVRQEVILYIEESRKIQVKALKEAISKHEAEVSFLPPDVIAIIGTSLALALNRESSLGVKRGHSATNKIIKQFFDKLEA